jgi:hypothetical protein
LERLLKAIDVCSPDPKAIVAINKMIPCILHLEIRVGIKIFSIIVSKGLSAQADRKDQHNFVSKVEKLVNHNGTSHLSGSFLSRKRKSTVKNIDL